MGSKTKSMRDEITELIADALDGATAESTPEWFRERIGRMGRKVADKVTALETIIADAQRELDTARAAPTSLQAELDKARQDLAAANTELDGFRRTEAYRGAGVSDGDRELLDAYYQIHGGGAKLDEWLAGPAREHARLAAFFPAATDGASAADAASAGTAAAAAAAGNAAAAGAAAGQRAARTFPNAASAAVVPAVKPRKPDEVKAEIAALRMAGKYEDARALIREQMSGA